MLAFAVSFFLIVLAVQLNSVKLPAPDPRQGPFWLTDLMFGLYISGLAVPSLGRASLVGRKAGFPQRCLPSMNQTIGTVRRSTIRPKGQQTRERILEKATEALIRRGFGATSVNDLVRATGVNRGSLYFHFAGKDDLGLAVLERTRQRFMEFIRGALDGETPGQRLDNFLTTALDVHMARGFVGGCLWGNTALEMSDAEGREPYVEAVRDVFDAWSGLLEEVIAAAQLLGQVRADIPADALARQVVATIEGGIMLSRVQHAPGPMRQCIDGLRTMLELRKTSHPKTPTPAATPDEDSPNPLNHEPGSERP